MGKQARLKRERVTGPKRPLMCLAKPAPMPPEEVARELAAALRAAAIDALEQARIDRQNNLPFSDAENVHKIARTFGPIEAWLNTLQATGDMEVLSNGLAVMQPDPDEPELFPVVESFRAVCDTYELIASSLHLVDGGDGLRKLANKIEVDMPLFQADLDAARSSISWMKEASRSMTPHQFSDYSVAIQTRATLAAIAAQVRTATARNGNCNAHRLTPTISAGVPAATPT